MSSSDAEKAIIALLTKVFFGLAGVAVLIVGGLLSLYITNLHTDFLLWSGSIVILIISAVCLFLMQNISKHIYGA